MYVAILCVSRNWSVSASESNDRVWVRWGRGRVIYLSSQLTLSDIIRTPDHQHGRTPERRRRIRKETHALDIIVKALIRSLSTK
jgi:hypothetical protein